MKKIAIAVLLLVSAAFAVAADKFAFDADSLPDELQWLALQTTCVGQYKNGAVYSAVKSLPIRSA
jgi:hypothetical protein